MYKIEKPPVSYIIKRERFGSLKLASFAALVNYFSTRRTLDHCYDNEQMHDSAVREYIRNISDVYQHAFYNACWVETDTGEAVPVRAYQQAVNTKRNAVVYVARYTGAKRRWKFKQYYRSPKTTGEARLNQVIDFDEPAARVSRTKASLPNSWDDVPRANYGNNNWKRFRKTQYKPVK